MEKEKRYEDIPAYKQEPQYIVEREPVDMGDYIYVGLEVKDVEIDAEVKDMEIDAVDKGWITAEELCGSSSTYYGDYYYQSTGQRIAHLGGYWAGGTNAGLFFWNLINSSSSTHPAIGGRLIKKPL